MRFDFSALLSGLIFGILGFLALKRGFSRNNYLLLTIGIVLLQVIVSG
jgi:membrane associated rhomboid family serine protease